MVDGAARTGEQAVDGNDGVAAGDVRCDGSGGHRENYDALAQADGAGLYGRRVRPTPRSRHDAASSACRSASLQRSDRRADVVAVGTVAYGGRYVALGALFANLMEGKFTHYDGDEFEVAPGEANLIGGAVFPIGLIAIFMTGANLYTGNCMYIMPPLINGNVPRGRAVAWLIVSWLSNFAGAGFVACVKFARSPRCQPTRSPWSLRRYFIAFQGQWTAKDPVKAYVMANATKKIDLPFAVAFLRGIGANWLVCLAWWQAISSKDTASKILSVRIVDVLITFSALSVGSAASDRRERAAGVVARFRLYGHRFRALDCQHVLC